MEFRIIELPSFKAASSGPDPEFDFSEQGILGRFDAYFSRLSPSPRDTFMPRDFLYFDPSKGGMVWIYALTDDMETGDYEVIDFAGGYYLTYAYKDGDEQAGQKLFEEARKYIEAHDQLELDVTNDRFLMGHIITPKEIIERQGWVQMESFIPIKLLSNRKESENV